MFTYLLHVDNLLTNSFLWIFYVFVFIYIHFYIFLIIYIYFYVYKVVIILKSVLIKLPTQYKGFRIYFIFVTHLAHNFQNTC